MKYCPVHYALYDIRCLPTARNIQSGCHRTHRSRLARNGVNAPVKRFHWALQGAASLVPTVMIIRLLADHTNRWAGTFLSLAFGPLSCNMQNQFSEQTTSQFSGELDIQPLFVTSVERASLRDNRECRGWNLIGFLLLPPLNSLCRAERFGSGDISAAMCVIHNLNVRVTTAGCAFYVTAHIR